ncbi:hypothetical protein [Candidatus Nitrosopumilus sp. SW]|uniref:hypothetical protein n=1 Tax=Candidatus Nitrosopumilus sp. SW TaxID=2508726 RepID=UPI00163AEE62|nr:hypothetical protein [Candidatus Nitrosopumilus sp. SW]
MRTTQTKIAEKSFDELIEICKEYSSMVEVITKTSPTSVVQNLTSFENIGGET